VLTGSGAERNFCPVECGKFAFRRNIAALLPEEINAERFDQMRPDDDARVDAAGGVWHARNVYTPLNSGIPPVWFNAHRGAPLCASYTDAVAVVVRTGQR